MITPTNAFNIAALNGTDADEVRLDAVFQALCDPTRRHILR